MNLLLLIAGGAAACVSLFRGRIELLFLGIGVLAVGSWAAGPFGGEGPHATVLALQGTLLGGFWAPRRARAARPQIGDFDQPVAEGGFTVGRRADAKLDPTDLSAFRPDADGREDAAAGPTVWTAEPAQGANARAREEAAGRGSVPSGVVPLGLAPGTQSPQGLTPTDLSATDLSPTVREDAAVQDDALSDDSPLAPRRQAG